eukprot:423222-Amphidinium_carterae.2
MKGPEATSRHLRVSFVQRLQMKQVPAALYSPPFAPFTTSIALLSPRLEGWKRTLRLTFRASTAILKLHPSRLPGLQQKARTDTMMTHTHVGSFVSSEAVYHLCSVIAGRGICLYWAVLHLLLSQHRPFSKPGSYN